MAPSSGTLGGSFFSTTGIYNIDLRFSLCVLCVPMFSMREACLRLSIYVLVFILCKKKKTKKKR